MAKAIVIIDFSPNIYTDINLFNKASYIVNCLLNNANYIELAEAVLAIKAKTDAFYTLMVKKKNSNKQITAEKKVARAELESILSSTGSKIQIMSDINEQMIVNAGYDMKRKGTPIGVLPMPTNITVAASASLGSLDIKWDSVAHANIYELRYTTAPSTPESTWIHISSTRHKLTIAGLTRGQAYAIKITAVCTDPHRVWSDEIICYAM